MTLFRSTLFAAVCLAVLWAPAATAQTQPFTITTYTGNGQMICTSCVNSRYQNFEPITALVVDANGNPVNGVTVNWLNVKGGTLQFFTTVTGATGLGDGMTQNVLFVPVVQGSVANPFASYIVTASIGGGTNQTATFYETQALADQNSAVPQVRVVFSPSGFPPESESNIGGATPTPIVVIAQSLSAIGVPGVEVRILPNQTNPSMSCATTSGPGAGTTADPGTALTDSTGTATCNPVFSGTGSGSFRILVGGVAAASGEFSIPQGEPAGYYEYTNAIPLTVAPAVPASIQVFSGNGQTVNAGQPLNSPLVATVKDANSNPIVGQNVVWTVTPSTAGTFTNTTTVSSSTGQVQTGFTFAGTANGSATITVTAAGTSVSASFTAAAIPLVTVTSLQKLAGGDGQTAASGQPFTNPLVVQVTNSNGQSAGGTTVNFSVNGPVTLNNYAPTANSAGQAQVTATAGTVSTQTQATVTASVGSLSQTFTLTVLPPGPTITATSFVNAADQKVGSLSPCSLATVIGPGIAPTVQGTVIGASFAAGPLTLAGNSINFGGTAAPIFSLSNSGGQQSMTFQVPCEVVPSGGAPVNIAVGGGSATVNVPVLAASPGIYGSTNTDGIVRATLVRQDGSFVSLQNPARRGEVVTAYVTGLGPTTPQVGTNQLPPRGVNAVVNGTVVPGVAGGGAALVSSQPPQLTPDLVGVYAVPFVVPNNVNPGNNVGFSVGITPVGSNTSIFSNLLFIPVQ